MSIWDNFIEDLAVDEIAEDLRKASDRWLDDHKADIQEVGSDGAEAILVMAYLKMMPEEIQSPSLNIKKMIASAKLLDLASDHQECVDRLQESAKLIIGEALEKVLKHFVTTTLKSLIGALLVI